MAVVGSVQYEVVGYALQTCAQDTETGDFTLPVRAGWFMLRLTNSGQEDLSVEVKDGPFINSKKLAPGERKNWDVYCSDMRDVEVQIRLNPRNDGGEDASVAFTVRQPAAVPMAPPFQKDNRP